MEDDDADDNETDGNQKGDNSMLEEGYDADQEGDSDRSDETEQRPAKNKKQPKQRRRNEDSTRQQITKGLVIHPQICNIILQLLKVCYGTKLQTADSERYAIVACFVMSITDLEEKCGFNKNPSNETTHAFFWSALIAVTHYIYRTTWNVLGIVTVIAK